MKKSRTYKLKIGYREYTLRFVKRVDKDDSHGDTDYTKGVLQINRKLRGSELANTILHEACHAMMYDRGISLDEKLEEQIVMAITNAQVAFIKDNPSVFKELMSLMGVECLYFLNGYSAQFG
jgi:hypothetical protein